MFDLIRSSNISLKDALIYAYQILQGAQALHWNTIAPLNLTPKKVVFTHTADKYKCKIRTPTAEELAGATDSRAPELQKIN